jgi:hypothetical protein
VNVRSRRRIRLSSVGVFDVEIVILALDAGRRDEAKSEVVEEKEAREIEFGESRLNLLSTNLLNAVVEPSTC